MINHILLVLAGIVATAILIKIGLVALKHTGSDNTLVLKSTGTSMVVLAVMALGVVGIGAAIIYSWNHDFGGTPGSMAPVHVSYTAPEQLNI